MLKARKNFRNLISNVFRALRLSFEASPWMSLAHTLLILLQALLPIASLYILKILVEMIANHRHESFDRFVATIVVFCVVQLVIGITNHISSLLSVLHQQKLMDYMSGVVLDKAVSVKFSYYENTNYYNSLHLAQQQSIYRVAQLLNYFNAIVLNCLSLLFLTSLLASMHWLFAMIFIMLSIPIAVIKWHYANKSSRLEMDFVATEREANYLHQILTGANFAKEARTLGFGLDFIRKFKALRTHIYTGKKNLQTKLSLYSSLVEILEYVSIAFIFILLAKKTWSGLITVGSFVIYLQGFQRLQSSAKNFLQSLVQVLQQNVFLSDLFRFLDLPTPLVEQIQHQPLANAIEISTNNLIFSYPETPRTVLENVSIKCSKNTIVAIVGENGSGKSTLVKLLAKLYDAENGSILVNGMPINRVGEEDFRKRTFFLFQDFEKYYFTAKDNITLGSNAEEVDNNKLLLSSKQAGAYDFIVNLSKGFETRLGRTFAHSEQLSGGQWQKLALARAFYSDADLLVLDEPTSAIDAIAEHDIFLALKKETERRSIILVSHRLYNIKLASYIYVMSNGKITEEGDFQTLIQKNGLFKKMYDKQKLD